MDNLDLSSLSDDQVLGLIRAALQEAVRRHPAMEAAARSAVLDEAEKAKIQRDAADREASISRARERERVAAEAAAAVRAEQARQNAGADARREQAIAEARAAEARAKAEAAAQVAKVKAAADVAEAERRAEAARVILLRAANLVDLPPWSVTVRIYDKQVFINQGSDKYDREHLVTLRGLTITTKRGLIAKKPALLEFCAELRALYTDATFYGCTYFEAMTEGGAA